MKTRGFQARRLDVMAFGEQRGQLTGQWPLSAMARLISAVLSVPDGESVAWSAEAEVRRAVGAVPQVWLHVSAQATVMAECQRCLQPMPVPLCVDRWFRFVSSEEQADREDLDAEEDVLVASHAFDLQTLVEDELLMTLPMVPMHAQCDALAGALEVALPPSAPGQEAIPLEAQRENPFAVLAALKRKH